MNKAYLKYFVLLTFDLIGISCSFSRTNKKEFQGIVKYTHSVFPKMSSCDANRDLSFIGHYSDYYYKSGNYKWMTYDSYYLMDLFLSKESKNLFLTNRSDSIYWIHSNIPNTRIIDFKIDDSSDSIIGYKCKILTIRTKPIDKDEPICIRRFYYSNEFYVNYEYFKNYKYNNQDFIYSQIQSVPLKIEMEYPDRIVTWKAKSIERTDIKDDFFILKENTKYVELK